jgi:monoamine oxidase
MGQGAALGRGWSRRAWLGAAALGAAGCEPGPGTAVSPGELAGGWIGAAMERGHSLQGAATGGPSAAGAEAPLRRCAVAVLGAGVAGLAAARALRRAGVDDLRVFELEDTAGGNARSHTMAGLACPLGAHYLPVPPPQARAVSEFLHEAGLLRTVAGRTLPDERYLCHALQERLWTGQEWVEGLLPPTPAGSATDAAYRRFSQRLAEVAREARFAVPADAAPWSAALQALDGESFALWLARERLNDAALLGYLDYACRDDYGAGLEAVSAWAGLHYFASRHGFGAGGGEGHNGVFTWPEGNAWLTRRLAAPLGERLHTGCLVRRVQPSRHGVALEVHDATGTAQRWLAREVVVALPLHVAARIVEAAPAALAAAAAAVDHAPWLVANLLLREPPVDRVGARPAWDNVFQVAAGPDGRLPAPESPSRLALGYVDAGHQGLRAQAGPVVLTAYWAFGQASRAGTAAWRRRLRDEPWTTWAERVVGHLAQVHPDLPGRLLRVDLMRYGHAMAVPAPGVRGHPALRALRGAAQPGGPAVAGPAGSERLHLAHADLAGYSVFEEAFTLGDAAGRRAAARLGCCASGSA